LEKFVFSRKEKQIIQNLLRGWFKMRITLKNNDTIKGTLIEEKTNTYRIKTDSNSVVLINKIHIKEVV
jgi:RNase P/RNase MRP subunit p29